MGTIRLQRSVRVLISLSVVVLVLIAMTFPCWFERHWIELFTMVGTLATALIIMWQARLLRMQNQVDALLGLNERWESEQLLKLRRRWAMSESLLSSEAILEFLEEFAALLGKHREVFNEGLIWDSTLGWYAAHYFIYNRHNRNIQKIHQKWSDKLLYRSLRNLTVSYLKMETKNSEQTTTREVIKRMISYKVQFLDDERRRYEL